MPDNYNVKIGAGSGDNRLNVRIGQSPGVKVLRQEQGKPVVALRDLTDVDVITNGQLEGSILQYNATTKKWTSIQTFDGGEF